MIDGTDRPCSKEADIHPTSEATKLEGPTKFHEYSGVGKLRRKKVIITGGEYGFILL